MKFTEFLEEHKNLMKGVRFDPGMPGFIDVMRLWNSIAITCPEKCEDVVVWDAGTDPRIGTNMYRKDVQENIKKAREKVNNKAKIDVKEKDDKEKSQKTQDSTTSRSSN